MKKYNNYLNEISKTSQINEIYNILDKYRDIEKVIEINESLIYINLDGEQNIFFILTALTQIKNIELLFEYNLDINLVDDAGYTPIILAAANYASYHEDYYFELLDIYSKHNANWNIKNDDGLSMLDYLDGNKNLYNRIIEKYPEKFESWKKWKKSQNFNL